MEKVLKLIMNSKENPERKDVEYGYHNVPTLSSDELLTQKEQASADEGKEVCAPQKDAGEAKVEAGTNPEDSTPSNTGNGNTETISEPTANMQHIPVMIVSEQEPSSQNVNLGFARAFYFRMLRRSDDSSDQGSNELSTLERRTCMIEMYMVSIFIILLVVFCMVLKIYLIMQAASKLTPHNSTCTMSGFVINEDVVMDYLGNENTTLTANGTMNVTNGTVSMGATRNVTSDLSLIQFF